MHVSVTGLEIRRAKIADARAISEIAEVGRSTIVTIATAGST
jgi:hypothetical protein